MCCQPLHRRAGDAAAEFHVQDDLFHARNGRAGQGFAFKVHVEVSVQGVRHANRSRVLAGTAEEKFSQRIGLLWGGAILCAQEERAGTIAEQAAEFSGYAAGLENAAVNIGGDDGDDAGLPRSDEALGYGKSIEQTEAGAADIQRAAGFASEELGMKLRRQRRITAMRLARGNDPVEFLSAANNGVERLPGGKRTKRDFILVFGRISK